MKTRPPSTMALLLDGREATLIAELDGVRAPQLRRLLEECERYRSVVLAPEHPDASITYFGPAAANLALAYRVTGQPQYLAELRRWLAVAVAFEHWGKAHMPDHDLDAGWLLHGLGLAYSWAGASLPEGERVALRDKLLLQGTRLYDFAVSTEGEWWASSYWQNHNWICFAGLATAGYALADEREQCRAWTELAKSNFRTVFDLLPSDGSNSEGVVYWRYGVPWLVNYLDVLRSAEGIDWFAGNDYLGETFWFRLYQSAPDLERVVNHGDCHDLRSGHSVALYYKLASEYRIGEAQWLADTVARDFFWREAYESGLRPGVRAEAYQELLWFDPTVAPANIDRLPTSRFFADLGLVSARTSWAPDATLVSFKASPGGGHTAWRVSHEKKRDQGWTTLNAGHHHPDAGSFVVLGYGEYLAIDEGYSSRKSTAHHNSFLVDGQGFANENRYHVYEGLDESHTASILRTTSQGGWTHAVSESAAMYDPALGVSHMTRHIVLAPSGVVVLVDELAASEPRRFTWLLQTHNPAYSCGDSRWGVPAGGAAMLVTTLDAVPTRCSVTPTAVFANPTSSTPTLVIEKLQYTLSRTTNPTRGVRFITVIEPRQWNDLEPALVTLGRDAADSALDDEVRVIVARGGRTEHVVVRMDAALPDLSHADAAGPGFAGRTVADVPARANEPATKDAAI
jgi:hypothetical protein